MSTPSHPRRYLLAGLATAGLIGGSIAVASSASASGSGTPSSPSTSSATPATPPAPPTPRPHIDGVVTGVSGDTVTVKDPEGFTRQIAVTANTKYTLDGKSSSLSAVTTGRFVHSDGTVDANGTTLDATTVAIMTSMPKPGAGPAKPGPGTGPAALPNPGAPSGKAPTGSAPTPPTGSAPSSGAPSPTGSVPAPSSTSVRGS